MSRQPTASAPLRLAGMLTGLASLGRAARLLLTVRRLRALAAIPAVLSFVVLLALLYVAWQAGPLLAQAVGGALAAAPWLATAALLGVAAVLGLFLPLLILEPFIDLLSEATDRELEAEPPKPSGWRALVATNSLVFVDIAVDLLRYLAAQLLVMLTWLTPFAAIAHPLAAWLVTAWFAGVAMVCGPLVRRGWRGRARWRAMRPMAGLVFGVGVGSTLLSLIPLAQLVTVPVAVVAGTLVVVMAEQRGWLPTPPAMPKTDAPAL